MATNRKRRRPGSDNSDLFQSEPPNKRRKLVRMHCALHSGINKRMNPQSVSTMHQSNESKMRLKHNHEIQQNQENSNRFGSILCFEYLHDFDENGFVHFLGTHSKTNNSFKSPTSSGLVTTSSSPLMADSASSDSIVDRTCGAITTEPIPGSWILIDFGDYEISPSHYTLQHSKESKDKALRNWHFEGSTDGQSWCILSEHANDASLSGKGATFSWQIGGDDMGYYSMVRIKQFGVNSNGTDHLVCSRLEIYGQVRCRQNQEISNMHILSNSDIDDSEIEILPNTKHTKKRHKRREPNMMMPPIKS